MNIRPNQITANTGQIPNAMRIGLLEDDIEAALSVATMLGQAGHTCRVFHEAESLKRFLNRETVDILLLDWNVPGMDGVEFLKWSRQHSAHHPPTLMLTNRTLPDDIIAALRAGADEYVTKPIEPPVLLARIEALARLVFSRVAVGTNEVHGRFRLDETGNLLSFDDQRIELTAKEFGLARLLLRNHGRTLSRAYILEAIWGLGANVNTRTLDVHLSRLRKAFMGPENGCRLRPVYGYGYRLELDEELVTT